MARLELILLGPCQFALDGATIAHVESNKVRGLLAFLAVEHHRPRPRAGLADSCGRPVQATPPRSNFRRALANLRAAIGDRTAHPPYLHITRETVQFNLASDATVDVVRFLSLVKTPDTQPAWVQNLEQAVALYRGPFLEGLDLDDCPEFEQWMTTTRSALEQLATGALFRLAEHYHIQAEGERALALYRRCLALDPFHEAAQRGLMRLLAANGQRAAALAHYAHFAASCCKRSARNRKRIRWNCTKRSGKDSSPRTKHLCMPADTIEFDCHPAAARAGRRSRRGRT